MTNKIRGPVNDSPWGGVLRAIQAAGRKQKTAIPPFCNLPSCTLVQRGQRAVLSPPFCLQLTKRLPNVAPIQCPTTSILWYTPFPSPNSGQVFRSHVALPGGMLLYGAGNILHHFVELLLSVRMNITTKIYTTVIPPVLSSVFGFMFFQTRVFFSTSFGICSASAGASRGSCVDGHHWYLVSGYSST